jgi:hypothetical protein
MPRPLAWLGVALFVATTGAIIYFAVVALTAPAEQCPAGELPAKRPWWGRILASGDPGCTCPAGYRRDEATGDCVCDERTNEVVGGYCVARCGPNQDRDQLTGECKCKAPFVPSEDGKSCQCPSGYEPDERLGCIIKCTAPRVPSSDGKQCVCPTGTVPEEGTARCVVQCPPTQRPDGGEGRTCVCKPGLLPTDDPAVCACHKYQRMLPDQTCQCKCPAHYEFKDGACVPVVAPPWKKAVLRLRTTNGFCWTKSGSNVYGHPSCAGARSDFIFTRMTAKSDPTPMYKIEAELANTCVVPVDGAIRADNCSVRSATWQLEQVKQQRPNLFLAPGSTFHLRTDGCLIDGPAAQGCGPFATVFTVTDIRVVEA